MKVLVRRPWLISLQVGLALASQQSAMPALHAQGPPRSALERASWTSTATFTQVSAIRELSDGTVLVADPADNRLVLISSSGVELQQVGRSGRGPGEYESVRDVFPLGQDSSLFIDAFSLRKSILHGARFVETGTPELGSGEIRGTDLSGRLLVVQPTNRQSGIGAPSIIETADSLELVLVNRRSGRRDTVGVVKGRGRAGYSVRPTQAGRDATLIVSLPLSVEDGVLLLADGSVAVVHADGYRLDLRAPDGSWSRGPLLPFESIQMNSAERCFAKRRMFHASFPCSDAAEPGWPSTIPPFVPRTKNHPFPVLLNDHRGRVLIARTPNSTSTKQLYDVVGRDGRLVTTIELPLGEALVGSGRGTIYSVVTDADGLQSIRRHPWP